MKKNFNIFILTILIAFCAFELKAQKVAFINTDVVRDKFPEVKQAEARIQTIDDEWKRELEALRIEIENTELEIKKNRLIWTEGEKIEKQNKVDELKKKRGEINSKKYLPGGEFDGIVKTIMSPIETKIFATVQEVSAEEGYDIVFDQSTQNLPYVNFKYDLTLKVLRKLGVDVEALEKEHQAKVDSDPRNQKPNSKTGEKRVVKRNDPNAPTETKKPDNKDFEPNNSVPKPDNNGKIGSPPNPFLLDSTKIIKMPLPTDTNRVVPPADTLKH